MQGSKLRPPGGAKLRPLRRIACKFKYSDEQRSQNPISPSISSSSDGDICAESKSSKIRRFITKTRGCAKKYAPVAKLALKGAAAASAACPPAQAAVAAAMVVADASEVSYLAHSCREFCLICALESAIHLQSRRE
ncbi:hypothetical protein HWV62_32087 [Athelia sp. TMB]|nr:hypothetical protein HWV62_32087 [Athelia sp. TMB]